MEQISNLEIRTELLKTGIKSYEVAMKLGYSESYFSRIMRYEMSEKDQQRVMNAINEIEAEKNHGFRRGEKG